MDKLSEGTILLSDWSEMPDSPRFKFSDIQDVILLRIVLKLKAHLAMTGQKRNAFDPVRIEYEKDAASAPVLGRKYPTANTLRWRLIVLMRFRMQYSDKMKRIDDNSSEKQDSSDVLAEMMMSEVQKEKTFLIDQVLEDRHAAGITLPPMKTKNHIRQEHIISNKSLRSRAKDIGENPTTPNDKHSETTRAHIDNDKIMHGKGASQNNSSSLDHQADSEHPQHECDGSNVCCDKDRESADIRKYSSANNGPSLPIANPFMKHAQLQLSRHSRSVNIDSDGQIDSEGTENDGYLEIEEVNQNRRNLRNLSNELTSGEIFTSHGNISARDEVFGRNTLRRVQQHHEAHWDVSFKRTFYAREKRVRFLEEHDQIDNDVYTRGPTSKRTRSTSEDGLIVDRDSSPFYSPSHIPAIPRLSSSSREGAEPIQPLRPPSPLPSSLPSFSIALPSSPTSTAVTRPSLGMSSISSSPDSSNQGRSAPLHSAVAPPPACSGPFRRTYGTGSTSNQSKKPPQSHVGSNQPSESIPRQEQVIQNGMGQLRRRDMDSREVVQNNRNLSENDNNEEMTEGATLNANGERPPSQAVFLGLIQELADMEREHILREKEEYAMIKQLLGVLEQRAELDIRRLDMEKHNLRRTRELEKRRLKMEERNCQISHDRGVQNAEKIQELERERLELERNSLLRLAEERRLSREMDQRRMEMDCNFRRRVLDEYREESLATRQMFTAMHEARVQHRATNNIGGLWGVIVSMMT